MEPLTFDSDDVGLVEATVSKLYSKMSIGAIGSSTRAQIKRHVISPEVGFDDLDYSFDIGYRAEAQSFLILCEVVSNTIRRVGEGWDETFGPGDLFVISRPDLPYAGVAYAPRLRFSVIDPAILTRVADAAESDLAVPVQLLDHRPVSQQAARHLQRSIAYIRHSLLADPEAAKSPLVVSTAVQYLAAGVLHAFPNNTATNQIVESQHDANSGTMRRAIAFIDDNPDLDISVSDIASAAYVTPRAVQLAFRKYLGLTPLAYLRRVRLEHARNELGASNPDDGTTVTDVAYRWGFSSPSHFADYYRAEYGESPSATLRR